MNEKFFKDLLVAPSPSGSEDKAVKVWRDAMDEVGVSVYEDKMKNSAYSVGNGPIKILLSGHIDEVQGRVTYISDNGILSMISTGGICKKSLVASHVLILNSDGSSVEGIVEKVPIHLEEKDAADKVENINTFKINIGASTKDEAEKMGVNVGSIVIYARNTNMNFGPNQICSQGLDDKVGVYITYEILSRLASEANNSTISFFDRAWASKYTVIGLASTQEETGLRGATVAAKSINPDISIDFDVTFATDGDSGIDKCKNGDIKLGGGGVIQYGPDKSERLNRILVESAKEAFTSFQRGASRAGGTNTDAIQLNSTDCETTLISVPNRNMHTPIEVVDKRDIESIVNMVTRAIRNCLI